MTDHGKSDVSKLKPCPFCGGPAELIEPHDNTRPYVMCVSNFCTGPKLTPQEAVAAWNRRTETAQ